MPEFLPYLLVPVAALLFLNLRSVQAACATPTTCCRPSCGAVPASFLFRSFRTYYDVLLDGAMAVVLAFAFAPPQRARPAAVVIDGSRSMVAGFAGERPLDKALAAAPDRPRAAEGGTLPPGLRSRLRQDPARAHR